MDLIIRNATLPDGRQGIDLAIDNGRIANGACSRDAARQAAPLPIPLFGLERGHGILQVATTQ